MVTKQSNNNSRLLRPYGSLHLRMPHGSTNSTLTLSYPGSDICHAKGVGRLHI